MRVEIEDGDTTPGVAINTVVGDINLLCLQYRLDLCLQLIKLFFVFLGINISY